MIGAIQYGCDSRTARVFVRTVISHPDPPFVESIVFPKRRGRPRLHADNAAKMRASRARMKEKKAAVERENDRLAEIGKIAITADCDPPFVMADAPHGKGLLVTGGWGPDKVAEVDAARIKAGVTEEDIIVGSSGSGQRVVPQGHGPSEHRDENSADDMEAQKAQEENDKLETENTFIAKQGWKAFFRNSKKLGPTLLKRTRVHLLCPIHSFVHGRCFGIVIWKKKKRHQIAIDVEAFEDHVTGRWILTIPAIAKPRRGVWELACGCRRQFIERHKVTDKTVPIPSDLEVEQGDNGLDSQSVTANT